MSHLFSISVKNDFLGQDQLDLSFLASFLSFFIDYHSLLFSRLDEGTLADEDR